VTRRSARHLERAARGGIVIVVAHRPSALAAVDLIMEMRQGCRIHERKDEFIKKGNGPRLWCQSLLSLLVYAS
jgi:ABC-type protease/lipase transport system fused ATPase/permease subunit